MSRPKTALTLIGVLGISLAAAVTHFTGSGPGVATPRLAVIEGDVESLMTTFNRWKVRYESQGGDRALKLGLRPVPSASAKSDAHGSLTLDLLDGSLHAEAQGLEAPRYDLWLVDSREGAGSEAPANDQRHHVGTLSRQGERWTLEAHLERATLYGFTLDRVVVTPEGAVTEAGVVLTGAPGFMQKLYYSDKAWAIATVGDLPRAQAAAEAKPFDFLLPKLAHAHAREFEADLASVVGDQIAHGRRLFLKETFGGNGRTCGTCHRPENNHTIDPKFIAGLPKDDPLFVAEYNPALKELENPALLRQFGLIRANADGFDRPPVMRSVPHLRGLAVSMVSEGFGVDASGNPIEGEFSKLDKQFCNALGWSGDGSATERTEADVNTPCPDEFHDDGSLKVFAKGAVIQHLTKTLNRIEGVDFRSPNEGELEALEAYMLSLGRSKDVTLAQMEFKSPLVERGKKLFDTKQNPATGVLGETANCNGCHVGAGANSSTTFANPTRDTAIENLRENPALLVDPSIAYDGGFGREQRLNCGPKFDKPCYGDARFNTPSAVEAADTGPYFHNHSVNTLEEAIAYYNSDAFNHSPGAVTSKGADRRINLDSSQITAIALFLRTLNAVENIRTSNQTVQNARRLSGPAAKEAIRLAVSDTQDAIEVLREGGVIAYPEVLKTLEEALTLEKLAALNPVAALRNAMLAKATGLKKSACEEMVTEQVPFFCVAPWSDG